MRIVVGDILVKVEKRCHPLENSNPWAIFIETALWSRGVSESIWATYAEPIPVPHSLAEKFQLDIGDMGKSKLL